jgi:hypothetical protein
MNTLRKTSLPVLGLLAAFTLAGCSLLSPPAPVTPAAPETPAAPAITAADLADTTWTGTDSEGTPTTFTFHAGDETGGSTAVSFTGNPYDDPGDTWALSGSTLTITIYHVESVGDATYVGDVTDPAGPIDLNLTFSDVEEARTLTITKG